MTKRILGLVLALAALAVIVFPALRYNTYTSLVGSAPSQTASSVGERAASDDGNAEDEAASREAADSLSGVRSDTSDVRRGGR